VPGAWSDSMLDALLGLKTAYALADSAGWIVEHDARFSLWVTGQEGELSGQALVDVLPELVGQEEALQSLCRGESPFWKLDYLQRTMPNGDIRYLSLTIVRRRSEQDIALVVLVTDITEQGTYLQQLTQSRNEILLLQNRIKEFESRLDDLLHRQFPPSRRNRTG